MFYIEKNYSISKNLINSFICYYNDTNEEYIVNKLSNSNIIWYDDLPYNEGESILNHIVTNVSYDKLKEYINSKKEYIFSQSGYIDEFNLLILPQNGDLTHIENNYI